MLHIFKDLLNPHNWFKLIKNPLSLKRVFNARINYYPGTKYGFTKSKIIKKFYIYFNLFIAKKNKQFEEIFFKSKDNTDKVSISFNVNNGFKFNEQHLKSLKENGILVLEEALPKQEHDEICKKFNKIKKDIEKETSYKAKGELPDTINKTLDANIYPDSTLTQISNQITRNVYGKSIIPTQYYMYSKSINLPDRPCPGDNMWHSDRYLPNLKLIYYPFGVKIDSSPFRYILGSHKINRDYLNFFINNDGGTILEDSEYGKKLLKNSQKLDCAPNTLTVAFTNGFHGRTPFEKQGDRSALFFTYPNFNMLSLICFWRYNS